MSGKRRPTQDEGGPIRFAEIEVRAQNPEEHEDAYHFLRQSFLQKPLMTKKCFYLLWISFITEIEMNRLPGDIQQIDVKEEKLDSLCLILQANCNKKFKNLGLRLVECADEETGNRFITIISERPMSDCLIAASNFTPDKRCLADKFVEEIMNSKDGYFGRLWAIDRGRELPNAMSAIETETFIQSLIENHWLKEEKGLFTFGTRGVAELNRLLVKKYDPDVCLMCKQVIILKNRTRKCIGCQGSFHLNCFNLICKINDSATVKCLNERCRSDIPKEKPNDETESEEEPNVKEEPIVEESEY